MFHENINMTCHEIINGEGGGRARLPACAAAVGIRGAGAGASRRLTGAVAPRYPGGSIGDLVEGIGPPDFGLQAPGIGAAGGISGHGARRRRADADRVGLAGRAAGRGTGPGGLSAWPNGQSRCCTTVSAAIGPPSPPPSGHPRARIWVCSAGRWSSWSRRTRGAAPPKPPPPPSTRSPNEPPPAPPTLPPPTHPPPPPPSAARPPPRP